MRKSMLICPMLMTLLAVSTPEKADAHIWFSVALKRQYDFRTVSCYACHLNRNDAYEQLKEDEWQDYDESPKSYYNSFGKQLLPLLKDKKLPQRYQEYRALRQQFLKRGGDSEELEAKIDEIKGSMIAYLQEALHTLDKMKEPASGTTYGELLMSGEIEGVRLRDRP